MKILVAITGASGAVYARRLLEALADARAADARLQVAVCLSDRGRQIWQHEIGGERISDFPEHRNDDFCCAFASGSADWQAVVVVPCSVGRLARIAAGLADDLIARAADVALKERRKLILVLRETPLSLLHIENMATVTRAGAIVLPATPSFYSRPATLEAAVDTVVARIVDQLGVAVSLAPRWGEAP
ncbi:MAG: UbiX family flavin prenyltransferase [Deltaproteobacteria bacterium]|nr:UbiX family flavin prenyltransferase [Deltaproteobacteria bacterium]